MRFILVNGRTPRAPSFCTLCCKPIGEKYLREIASHLSYCTHACYVVHCRAPVQRRQERKRVSS